MFLGAVEQKLYNREVAIYEYLHPKLREIQRNTNGLDELNAGYLYHSHLDQVGSVGDNSTVLVFQDLKSLGYRMVDKRIGCTVEEARLTLSALANYHALTIAFLRSSSNGSISIPEPIHFVAQWPMYYLKAYDMLCYSLPHYIELLKALNHQEVAYLMTRHHHLLTIKIDK